MDKKVLELLEKLITDVNDIKNVMATKEDLKKALSNYPTKEDLKKALSNYPTKEDLKKTLEKLREDISEDLSAVNHDIFIETDKIKADKVDLVVLEERVDKIEQKLAY